MTAPAHTPTPWKYEWDEEVGSFRLWFKDGDFKDRPWNMTPILIRHEATAAFIVRAVNAVDDLVARVRDRMGECPCGDNTCTTCQDDAAAIAKAEGRP